MPADIVSKRSASPDVGARRAKRRDHLLDAADRVVRRRGASASINEIAVEAKIAKPVLYRHFGDKGGLFRALAERYVAELMSDLRMALGSEADPRQRLRATIDVYLGFVEARPEPYEFLMRRPAGERVIAHETVTDFIVQVAEEVALELQRDLQRNGLDTAGSVAWGHGIVGMVQLAGDWWLRTRAVPRHVLVDQLSSLLWRGFMGLASDQTPQDITRPPT